MRAWQNNAHKVRKFSKSFRKGKNSDYRGSWKSGWNNNVRKFSKSFRIVVKVSISTGKRVMELRTAVQLYKDHEGRKFSKRRGRSCRLKFAIIRFLCGVTTHDTGG
jgi:hypothetical protein